MRNKQQETTYQLIDFFLQARRIGSLSKAVNHGIPQIDTDKMKTLTKNICQLLDLEYDDFADYTM